MTRLFESSQAQRSRQAFNVACARAGGEEAEVDPALSTEGQNILSSARELRTFHAKRRQVAENVEWREYHAACLRQLDAGLNDRRVARVWLALEGRWWSRLLEWGVMPSTRQLVAFGVPRRKALAISRLRLPKLPPLSSSDSKRSA